MKKVYFAGSIRGGRIDAELYCRLIKHMQQTSIVLTEHIGNPNLNLMEQGKRDVEIYEEDITWEQRSFIENFFNKMESAALANNFTDENVGYRKYLDLDSFLRNFIVGEFCGNPDMLWSVYMYKDISDGKLYAGPTWDHDLSFDNDYTSHPINGLNNYVFCTKGRAASDAIRRVTERIIRQDPEAKELLIEIWEEAYENGGLKKLIEYADETERLIQESQELNFKRWPILDEKVHMNFQALGSHKAEVQFVKTCINDRLVMFDKLVRR